MYISTLLYSFISSFSSSIRLPVIVPVLIVPLSQRLLLRRSTSQDDKDVMKARMRLGSSYNFSFNSSQMGGAKDDTGTYMYDVVCV